MTKIVFFLKLQYTILVQNINLIVFSVTLDSRITLYVPRVCILYIYIYLSNFVNKSVSSIFLRRICVSRGKTLKRKRLAGGTVARDLFITARWVSRKKWNKTNRISFPTYVFPSSPSPTSRVGEKTLVS